MADARILVTTGLFHLPVYSYTKILELIVYSSISKHLQSYDVLHDAQHRFHPNRSCDTQLIVTINDFAECLNKVGQCDVLALDYSKVFDKVPHAHLYQKLSHYGVATWVHIAMPSGFSN